MIPLTDLGAAEYFGFSGGLYPHGKNSRPSAYEQTGVTLGEAVRPLDQDGKPSRSGKIVMISIGMSNTSREFSEVIRLATKVRKNPRLLMLDGGRDGSAALDIATPLGSYWKHVDSQLQRAEVSASQVQVVWLKGALAYAPCGFPEKARLLQQALRSIVGILGAKFSQLRLIYVSSRVYGGYSKIELSPEPIAYETAFAVKWLIEERINSLSSDSPAPWLSWGPYLWANGTMPRSDGLIWERSDFGPDGVHPSPQGILKVARMLLEFFQNDTTAKPWFLRPGHQSR